MNQAKILMTGVSSFTGCYIAHALNEAGYEVTGILTKAQSEYTDPLIQKRLKFSGVKHFWEKSSFGSENFLERFSKSSFDFFVSHGAAIQGYRSPDFDFVKSIAESLRSIKEVFQSFSHNKLQGIIHTGTVFEPIGELPAASPYGLSKKMVWEAFRYFSQLHKIPLSKVWIPNPIGPFENEDRLIPVFVKQWKQGQQAKLTVPRLVYDHIPAEWLARTYAQAIADFLDSPDQDYCEKHYRPSGFVLSNQELVDRFREAYQDGKILCQYQIEENPDFKLGALRKNTEACPELSDPQEVRAFWNSYADYWK